MFGERAGEGGGNTNLGEGTVVPQVTLVGEAVADVAKLALLDVLLDGVEKLLLGDLVGKSSVSKAVHQHGKQKGRPGQAWETNLELGIGPAGDLDDHVQDALLLVGVQGDVVEGGDGDAILLNVDAVLQSVGSRDLADGVGHCAGWVTRTMKFLVN